MRTSTLAFVFPLALLSACGGSVNVEVGETGPDAGGDASNGGDTGVSPEGGPIDVGVDAGGCEAGAVDTEACGKCGTHVRVCNASGAWSDFSACSGETGECTPGETRSSACGGNCGVQTDTCSDACTWTTGTCKQGECAPGSVDTTDTGCSTGSERSRTCSTSCAWGSYGACTPATCTAGSTDTRACGKCGTQIRVCNSSTSTWSDWSACSGETGECAPGDARTVACGACGLGTASETCSATCAWGAAGTCVGETCEPGQVDTSTTGCTTGQVKTRTCSASCAWGAYGACGNPVPSGWRAMAAAPIAGRARFAVVWTGKEMLVWGGTSYVQTFGDGAAYDPVANTWRTLAAPPSTLVARSDMAFAWTGKVMLVWGGEANGSVSSGAGLADGAAYDPASNTWTTIAAAPINGRSIGISGSARIGAWSPKTNELVIWGGDGNGASLADGAAYNPLTNTWRTIATANAPTARDDFSMAYAGGKIFVWGGSNGAALGDGAAYDPVANTWSALPTAPITARFWAMGGAGSGATDPFFVFAGFDSAQTYANGATFDPTTNAWTAIPDVGTIVADAKRDDGAAWWANGNLYVFGGFDDQASGVVASGITYSTATKTWTAMPTANAPSARSEACAVWTGTDAIVWGGSADFQSALADGRLYRP